MTAIANLPDIRPSLLLDFANSGRVDPRIQCTRASAATCFGPDGKLRTVAANVPRIDYDPGTGKCLGLLVEEGRTNLWTNSAVAEAKTFAVTAQAYTLSFEGDGSVAFTGAYGGNSSAGTVKSGRRVLTFTPSAGSLTCTPSGNVRNVQFEAGAFPTSYIPTEAAAVTRAGDAISMEMPTYNDISICTDFMHGGKLVNTRALGLYAVNAISSFVQVIGSNSTGTASAGVFAGPAGPNTTIGAFPATSGRADRVAFSRAGSNGAMLTASRGGALTSGAHSGTTAAMQTLAFGNSTTAGLTALNGWVRRVSIWLVTLSQSQLNKITEV